MAGTLTQNPLLAGGSLRMNPLVPLQDQQDAALPAGDPSGYTMAGNALVSGIQQQRAQSAAMGLLDPNTGWPTTAGWKDAAQQYANGLLMGSTAPRGNGLLAYHGSPHDFDAFSLQKIGTGEGAQAYGHGLYFAQNEGTARSYRDALSGNMPSGPEVQWLAKAGGDPHKALAMFNEWTDGMGLQTDAQQAVRTKLDALINPNGRMYEVNLNVQPHELLDWDKPLSEQHLQVQQALADVIRYQKVPPQNNVGAETTAGQMLQFLESKFGDKATATDELVSSGIKGIRYLDQGSRGSGEGTSNYVIFDPATIEILRKYGIAGLGLGTAAAAAGQPTTP